MKKLYDYFKGKSIKQRIAICFVIAAILMFLFFIIKGNFFDIPSEGNTEQSSASQFHISIVDMALLVGVIVAYIIHKIREKRRQKRM